MSLLHAVIMAPFLIAAFIPLLRKRNMSRIHPGWFVLWLPVLLFLYFLSHIPAVNEVNSYSATMIWMPSLGIDFSVYLDGLALLFALLITGVGALVVLYSIYYMDKEKEAVHRFYIFLFMFMGAMLGVVISDNLMVLYGFWELTSISSFLLISFWHVREGSRYGALKSMLITVFGGLAMLTGFLMLYVMTGTFSIRGIIAQHGVVFDHPLFVLALVLVLLGAFTKSAQFPFHIWLPDAMEAPTPVSAYLHSATMVKAGIYLVARLTPVFGASGTWFWLVSAVGLFTMIFASFRAIKQHDLKGMLAFSTISQLGLIMSLLGVGSAGGAVAGNSMLYTAATTAAIFHIINHAIFKGSLFMVVGIVDHETGTRDIRRLGGLMSLMPITFTIAVIGAFSMAGIPPFNGFLSKEMFFTGMLNVLSLDIWNVQTFRILFPVIAWIGSVFTFGYSMVLVFKTFTGKFKPDQLEKKPHEAPLGMLISPVILVALAVTIGLYPNFLSHTLIAPAVAAVHPGLLAAGEHFEVHISMWHGWTPEVFMTLGVIVAGVLLYVGYGKFRSIRETWGRSFTLNRVYDLGLSGMERSSRRLTDRYMNGSVRRYLMYIFVFLIASLGGTMIATQSFSLNMENYSSVTLYEMVIVAVLAISALSVPFASSRIAAIIMTGAVGYMVTLLFVIFRAPDLALTQMIVETVSVTLFLLCFYHLPKLKKEKNSQRFQLTRFMISLGVGVMMTLIALSAGGVKPFASIADYFLENSYELGGGNNVVNVILVDFRGFDTMLEITVLGIAALAIFSMIRLSLASDHPGVKLSYGNLEPRPVRKSNDVIFKTTSRVTVFLILIFSLFLFLAGHNNPGGGFIGGLMTASSLVLLALSFGKGTMGNIVTVDFRKMIAIGLLIAYLTGLGSLLFDVPFLTHAFDHFHLPILGDVELATAVLFDLGVYLTVVGVTMTIILSIGGDKKSWN